MFQTTIKAPFSKNTKVISFVSGEIILGGDFSTMMNNSIDRSLKKENHWENIDSYVLKKHFKNP